jgi:hypothetical protein
MTTEQKPKETDATWEQLIAPEVEEAAPETFMREGDVLNIPSEENPNPVRVSELGYKGYVKVWDTKTGTENLQPQWFLVQTMKLKHEDGTPMYTRTNPHIPPNYGQDLFCPLNPESKEYASIAGRGFKPCRKHHIPHRDAVDAHVRKSHRRAYEALERDRVDRMRDEDRELQRETLRSNQALIQSVVGQSQAATATAVAEAPAPPTATKASSTHGHKYGKALGSPCRVRGCTALRLRPTPRKRS